MVEAGTSAGKKRLKARPYRVAEPWEEGAWMDHPTFGLGRVQRRLGKKVDVLFKDGLKTLVSA
jgi:hypothetical protein